MITSALFVVSSTFARHSVRIKLFFKEDKESKKRSVFGGKLYRTLHLLHLSLGQKARPFVPDETLQPDLTLEHTLGVVRYGMGLI